MGVIKGGWRGGGGGGQGRESYSYRRHDGKGEQTLSHTKINPCNKQNNTV